MSFSAFHKVFYIAKISPRRQRTRLLQTTSQSEFHMDINDMPDELLLMLFSYLSPQELYCIIRPVCMRWNRISKTTSLWKKITVGVEVPTNILRQWIQNSPNLRVLELEYRNDINCILKEISKHSPHIEELTMLDCWGSDTSRVIKSSELCKVLRKCKNLWRFDFHDVLIMSIKFFKTLAEMKNERKISYCGPINSQQKKYYA